MENVTLKEAFDYRARSSPRRLENTIKKVAVCRISIGLAATFYPNFRLHRQHLVTLEETSRSMTFSTLGLSSPLVRAVAAMGYTAPTVIQQAAIPVILQGRDVQAQAHTGSGKTAAFALGLLELHQRLHAAQAATPRRVHTLVLVPTRELAAQVGETFRALAQHLAVRAKIVVVYGGVSINPQMLALRGGADVVVATPGRLLDLLDHNALHLGQVRALVLDEADRLLDLGFSEELQRLLAHLPAKRQTLLFSATFAAEVQALAGGLLIDPESVTVAGGPANDPANEPAITQRVIAVDAARRTELLRYLITSEKWSRVLVFVATQYAAEHVAWKLHKKGLFATPFHGGLSQGARTQVLAEFKNEQWDVVVTTDLAARGIDIAQLPVVVNFDLPRSAIDYQHRIGRTGRAGHTGLAVSFVSADTEAHFQLIEKRQGLSLPREQVLGYEPVESAPESASAVALVHQSPNNTGGIKGKRPSKKDKLRAAAALAAKLA